MREGWWRRDKGKGGEGNRGLKRGGREERTLEERKRTKGDKATIPDHKASRKKEEQVERHCSFLTTFGWKTLSGDDQAKLDAASCFIGPEKLAEGKGVKTQFKITPLFCITGD